MRYANREEAARRLAQKLTAYRGQDPLILAIPRGAVPMGAVIARELDGELDVVLVRKIGAPGNPEFAIGSVSETGEVVVQGWAAEHGIRDSYVQAEAQRAGALLRQRRALYTPGRPAADPAGRVVIVLDDGVATGATLLAALAWARARHPRKLIAATAVAPPRTAADLRRAADEVVCLATPEPFYAVGEFFTDFSEVTDAEVVAALAAARDVVPAGGRG